MILILFRIWDLEIRVSRAKREGCGTAITDEILIKKYSGKFSHRR